MSNTAETPNCDATTKKPGNPKCSKAGPVEFEGKHYCKQHAAAEGWVDDAKVKRVAAKQAAKPAPAVKAAPPKAAPSGPVAPPQKAAAGVKAAPPKKVEAAEAEGDEDNVIVKPAKGKADGVCGGKKANGSACGHPAVHHCPSTCSVCEGTGFCGTHWNTAHKGANVSGGKSTRTRKDVPEDKKCSHNKTSGTKGPCTMVAYGSDANGDLACWKHGGPKKADAMASGGSTSSSGATAVPTSGVFIGIQWDRLTVRLCDYFRDSAGMSACAESEALDWLLEVIRCCQGGKPDTEALLKLFAKSGWSGSKEKEYFEVYQHTMLFVLRDFLGESDTNFIVRLYVNLSKEAGEVAAEVGVIWSAAAKECGISTAAPASSGGGTGSSTKGAAVLTSDRKPAAQKLIEKSRARKAAAEAESKGKEEPEPVEPEKDENGAEPMDTDIQFDLPADEECSQDENELFAGVSEENEEGENGEGEDFVYEDDE